MAATYPPTRYLLPPLASVGQIQLDTDNIMADAKSPTRWIDEEIYRTTVLSIWPSMSENEADENLQRDARDLGIFLPVHKPPGVNTITFSLSATTVSSETHQDSILSQSTAPTSCCSSERRPSTSLSYKSLTATPKFEMPIVVTEMERKGHSGFKSGLRKMAGFRRKRPPGSNTPSMTSMRSHMTGTTDNGSVHDHAKRAASIQSDISAFSHDPLTSKEMLEPRMSLRDEHLRSSMDCKSLVKIRTQQLEEKRRFLEYQNRLVRQLLDERDRVKAARRAVFERRLAEQEEKNEKAVEELEARQLEDELKQQKEHEAEKRAIQTRLKHMEAYCRTPSRPNSPLTPSFEHRPSIDGAASVPERHVTQQHYENLAQAYHIRDNMDNLHASKINVLRGKQKRALQNFMLKKERELEQMEKDYDKELQDSVDEEYSRKEAEIKHEFEMKRSKLEARWKLHILVERARLERSTGFKYDDMPDIVAADT